MNPKKKTGVDVIYTDTETYIKLLEETFPLRKTLLLSAIDKLNIQPGSRGLDAGCGVGGPALLLAEKVGSSGHVTGLDQSPEFLQYAREKTKAIGYSDRLNFRQGDINHLPFNEDQFDWMWSVDCAGYPAGDLLSALFEFKRVVKPGGTIAILAWSSQMFLPGYPLLEAKLNAECSSIEPYVTGEKPENIFLRSLRQFRDSGILDSNGVTLIDSVSAPLSNTIRKAIHLFFPMLWIDPQLKLSKRDWNVYANITDPDSPDFILNYPDYHAFFTYSMFYGKV